MDINKLKASFSSTEMEQFQFVDGDFKDCVSKAKLQATKYRGYLISILKQMEQKENPPG